MRTFIHYFLVSAFVLTIVSCEHELPFNVKDNPPKLVMNALVNADSLSNIVFLNLTGKEHMSHILDATLEVRINGDLKEQLRPLPIESEYLIPQCQFRVTSKLAPGDVLRLDAITDDGQYHAWSEVIVPRRLAEIENIDTLTIPLSTSGYTSEYLRHKITFTDLPDEDNYYRLIMDTRLMFKKLNDNNEIVTNAWRNYNFIYREDIVLTDGQPSTDDDDENGLFDTSKNIYGVFNDSRFKNSTYTMTVHVPRYLFQDIDDRPHLSAKIDIIVRLVSITEMEFYYLRALNLIDSDSFDETINEPVKFPSNVNGGIGFVGVSTEVSRVIQILDEKEPSKM